MENFAISDSQISASSEYNNDYLASFGRLNFRDNTGWAWSALTNDDNQWLQVDLNSQYVRIVGVATQGNQPYWDYNYVSSYKLQYSNDENNFYFYRKKGETTEKVI